MDDIAGGMRHAPLLPRARIEFYILTYLQCRWGCPCIAHNTVMLSPNYGTAQSAWTSGIQWSRSCEIGRSVYYYGSHWHWNTAIPILESSLRFCKHSSWYHFPQNSQKRWTCSSGLYALVQTGQRVTIVSCSSGGLYRAGQSHKVCTHHDVI